MITILTINKITELAKSKGNELSVYTISSRIREGWTLEEIISTPKGHSRRSKKAHYIVYRDDDYVMEGTINEISEKTGLTISTIYTYISKGKRVLRKQIMKYSRQVINMRLNSDLMYFFSGLFGAGLITLTAILLALVIIS